MKNNKIPLYFLIVSIFTFISIFIILVQSSYNNLVKPVNETRQSDLIKPIDPILDSATLDEIEKRNLYSQ